MIFHSSEQFTLYNGDSKQILPTLAENSIDSIVTDPPYELGFMGKSWDSTGIANDPQLWKEVLRVLKPGGYLLSFGGSRTYHRMAVAIEDAGFEIRDQIMWVYGSGFPKSHNISKGIDKNNGEVGRLLKFTTWMRTTGLKAKELDEATGTNMGGHYLTTASQPAIPTVALWAKIRPLIADVPQWVDELVDRIEAEREVVGKYKTDMGGLGGERLGNAGGKITTASTDAAKTWQGWGTALKPAHEPIVLARKPFAGTVANNVLSYGTGGINIDSNRVGNEIISTHNAPKGTFAGGEPDRGSDTSTYENHTGRWPANFIHDGSDEVVELFPDTNKSRSALMGKGGDNKGNSIYGKYSDIQSVRGHDDNGGSAARFFYCAKAGKRDRNEGCENLEDKEWKTDGAAIPERENRPFLPSKNNHPTVKPTDLMQYLCRLITPPGGTILDPFLGSGSTGKAAMYEGFKFVGIELTEEYLPIAKARIEFALSNLDEKLF